MKPLILIGRCGKETLKNIFKEEEYGNKDFNYLKRWILNNYKNKILSAENSYDVSKEIEISFSFVNKADDEEEDVKNLNEKIITCYFKCDGRILWSYQIQKYIEPKLTDRFERIIKLHDSNITDDKPIDDKKPSELDNGFPTLLEKPPVRISGNYHSLPSESSQTFSKSFNEGKELGRIAGQIVGDLAHIAFSLLKLGILLGGIVIGIILVIKFLQMWWSNWMLLFR